MDHPDSLTARSVPWADPVATLLRGEQTSEIRTLYGPGGQEPGTPPSATDVAVFLVVEDADGEPIGCGGLRPLAATVGEVKRMYVRPEHRGRGIARWLLGELEDRARMLGWTHLRLETGELQVAAIALYESAGYRRIERFGEYADAEASWCFERTLADG